MAAVSTYLNFAGETEAAFNFYKSVFGTEFIGEIFRHGAMPPHEGQTELSPEEAQLIMNVQLPILGGHVLMGTDAMESMGFQIVKGNNVHISLQPDTRAEADRLFAALSPGGSVHMAMAEQFWGYYGALTDKFGVQWMINCMNPA
jgi:PhnB protein